MLANEKYKKYLESGENATLNEYRELLKSIAYFYEDEVETEFISPSLGYNDEIIPRYEGMKNHQMIRCRWAIKKLDRELAKEGIIVDDLVKFEDPFADEVQEKINKFKNTVISELKATINSSNADNSSYSYAHNMVRSEKIVEKFVDDIYGMKLYDLQNFELPDPAKFVEDVLKKMRESEMITYNEIRTALIELNSKYLEYRKKGEDATYGEYVELLNTKHSNIDVKIDYDRIVYLAPQVLKDLRKQKVEIASVLDDQLNMIKTNKELACSSKQDKFNDEVREYLMGKGYSQKTHEKITTAIDKFNEDLLKHSIKEILDYKMPNPKDFVDELLKSNGTEISQKEDAEITESIVTME